MDSHPALLFYRSLNLSDPAVVVTLPHDSRGHVVVAVDASLLALATVALLLRLYTRIILIKHTGIDDYLALASLVVAWFSAIAQFICVHFGLGQHFWDALATQGLAGIMNFWKSFYAAVVMYNVGLALAKMTFLTQYYRVLSTSRMRMLCIGVMIIVGLWSLAQILISTFNCTPIARFWDGTIEGYCIPTMPLWAINGGGNILTDIMILLLPMPLLASLTIPIQQKIILIGIFCLGFFTIAISAIRISFIRELDDPLYELTDIFFWSVAELCSGSICASLPTLRPLLAQTLPRQFATIRTATTSTTDAPKTSPDEKTAV